MNVILPPAAMSEHKRVKKKDWERGKGGEGIRALSRTQLILSGARSGRSMWDCIGHVLQRDDDVM